MSTILSFANWRSGLKLKHHKEKKKPPAKKPAAPKDDGKEVDKKDTPAAPAAPAAPAGGGGDGKPPPPAPVFAPEESLAALFCDALAKEKAKLVGDPITVFDTFAHFLSIT
jgi:hypothetical protein